jgi:ABC-type Fe3+-hydroxamate transport system substrate-binding protein
VGPQDIEILAAEFPVWISDVVSVDDGINLIWLLGEYLNRQVQALALVDGILSQLPAPAPHEISLSYAYLIWRRPWMVAARETFIDAWLERFGLRNCFADQSRYPRIELDQLITAQPALVLLPDEPYPFTETERAELQALLPTSTILLVAGKPCSWYGRVMLESIPYLRRVLVQKEN